MTSLWQHQREAVEFLEGKPAAMWQMKMRTGKTLAALVGLAARGCRNVLVICPKSVVPVWPEQAEKHLPGQWHCVGLSAKLSIAKRAKRLEAERAMAAQIGKPLLVSTLYQSIIHEPLESLLTRGGWDALILDESHHAKAPDGRISKVCWDIARQTPNRLALTGTMMPHSPLDAFAQFRCLDESIFGTSFALHRARYAKLADGYRKTNDQPAWGDPWPNDVRSAVADARACVWAPRVVPSRLQKWSRLCAVEAALGVPLRVWLTRQAFGEKRTIEECAQDLKVPVWELIKGWLPELGLAHFRSTDGFKDLDEHGERLSRITFRCDTEDVFDLPPEETVLRYCTLGREGRRLYDDMEQNLAAEIREGKVTASNGLSRLVRLQQIANGWLPIEGAPQRVDRAKAELFSEVMEDFQPPTDWQAGEPVVVFGQLHRDLDDMHEEARKLGHLTDELSGRADIDSGGCAAWKAGRSNVLVSHPQSGGEGIDLSRSCYAVYYTLGWKWGEQDQSRWRIYGPDQTRPVTYYYLLAENTIDEIKLEALEKKEDVVSYALDKIANRATKTAPARRGP